MTANSLTERLWRAAAPLYQQILRHPFVSGLQDGSLPEEAFRFYIIQDWHYLNAYARALSLCASRAPHSAAVAMFNQHAVGTLAVERELHTSLIADFGLDPATVAKTPVAPTTLAYSSYLLAITAHGSFPEALGAVLPCYWIYWEVGKALLANGSKNPLYQRWIETYGGDEFAEVVRAVLNLTNEVGCHLSDYETARVLEHFVVTTRYEWMFWDMGYKQETWPI